MPRTKPLAYVLGGGRGTRLDPLTRKRAKPAVPFGGMYRVVDFVLSNLYHSGLRKINVLTQFESQSLHRHIKHGWYPRFGVGGDEFLTVLPATQRNDASGWYQGTADAIAHNRRSIEEEEPDIVDVFGGDHVYLMDVSQMNDSHLENEADLTIAGIPVRREVAKRNYGVFTVDENGRVEDFVEKPEDPAPIPENEDYCLASMGNYAFNPKVLLEELAKDARKDYVVGNGIDNRRYFTEHDFGKDVIPEMLRSERRVFAYNFNDNSISGMSEKEKGFWRDIGNIDQFYEANMEVRSPEPPLNLYNGEWEVLTHVRSPQPAKFVGDGKYPRDSILATGVIVSNADIEDSVLSYDVRVKDGVQIKDSILLGKNHIGKGARIERAILDKNTAVPDGETIGVDRERDEERGFSISDNGITVVPEDYRF